MPLNASFVHKTTGVTTEDASDHGWRWIRFDNDAFASKLTAFQPWVGSATVGSKLVHSWADVVALWSEVGRIGGDIVAYVIAAQLISPGALARGLELVLADMPTTAHTRPQGIRFAQHKLRELSFGGVISSDRELANRARNS